MENKEDNLPEKTRPKHLYNMSDEELKAHYKAKADRKLAVKEQQRKRMKKLNQEQNLIKDSKRVERMLEKGYAPVTMSNNVIAGVLSKKVEERVKKIIEWLGEGKSRIQILDKITAEYKLSKLSARNYFQCANRYLKEMSDEDREFMRDKHWAMMMKLYQENIDRGDLREAHNLLQTINKMFGINAPEKTEHTENIFEFKFNTAEPINPNKKDSNGDVVDTEYTIVDYFEENDDDDDSDPKLLEEDNEDDQE